MPFNRIEDALAAIARGEMVVVVDDAGRENEGDLIMAAEKATATTIAFMVRHTSGVVCAALSVERLNALQLPLMVADNSESHRTAFTITADYRHGTTTGISAADRAATLRALADPRAVAGDFVRPGHIFPLRARAGGVLERRGHTEAAVDLARLAGLAPAGVLCELVNEDGSMARPPELQAFAAQHGLTMISVADLCSYRRRTESLISAVAEARLPTRHGLFSARIYRDHAGTEHVALVMGDVATAPDVLVRVHSECLTGDVFGSLRCDCGAQLDAALARVAGEGRGVVVYLRGHEGRGVGLTSKMHAYKLQDQGRDTVEANLDLGLPIDARTYDIGAQILTDLGVTTLRLMSNNPSKFVELEGYDLRIVGRVPLLVTPNRENLAYLRTKQLKLGHELELA
jgi:3,4-dihydroxy 2-butanone 4-phosphate synthase/GTP cyclohydrolase II